MITFDEFLKEICPPFELDWRKFRRHAARRHLDERLKQLGIPGYGPYVELLRKDPAEAAVLPDLLRVTVSRFFREYEHWRFLGDEILPRMLSKNRIRLPLKAWSVGCCGGEEPYSLELLLLGKGWSTVSIDGSVAYGGGWIDTPDDKWPGVPGREWPDTHGSGPLEVPWTAVPIPSDGLDILATDIDSAVLARAGEGNYGSSSVREVPGELLDEYFIRKGDQYQLREEVRRQVRFKSHNLMSDEPPRGISLMLCRYLVFTYYTGELRYRAAGRLWQAMEPGGVLMVGQKDRLGPRERELFSPWPGSEVFFLRRD